MKRFLLVLALGLAACVNFERSQPIYTGMPVDEMLQGRRFVTYHRTWSDGTEVFRWYNGLEVWSDDGRVIEWSLRN